MKHSEREEEKPMSIEQMQCLQILNQLPESILGKLYDGRYDRLVRNERGTIVGVEEA